MESEITNQLFKYLGIIITAGCGGAVVASCIFKYFGKGWLDNHFAKRLENFKHAQNLEIDRLKNEFTKEFDQLSKTNNLMFIELPNLWLLISKLKHDCDKYLTSGVIGESAYGITEDQFIEFLSNDGLDDAQIALVMQSPNKDGEYLQQRSFSYQRRITNLSRELSEKNIAVSIYTEVKLFEKIIELIKIIEPALFEQKRNMTGGRKLTQTSGDKYRELSPPILAAIQSQIRDKIGVQIT